MWSLLIWILWPLLSPHPTKHRRSEVSANTLATIRPDEPCSTEHVSDSTMVFSLKRECLSGSLLSLLFPTTPALLTCRLWPAPMVLLISEGMSRHVCTYCLDLTTTPHQISLYWLSANTTPWIRIFLYLHHTLSLRETWFQLQFSFPIEILLSRSSYKLLSLSPPLNLWNRVITRDLTSF